MSCPNCNGRGWIFERGTNSAKRCHCSPAPVTGRPLRREHRPHTRARATDPATSHAAARVVCPNLPASQWRVYNALRNRGPMIDEETRAEIRRRGFDMSGSRVRTARSELVEQRLVRDTGRTRPTTRGRDATVWEAVPFWRQRTAG